MCTWLREQGYEILALNARVGRWELDIVAQYRAVAIIVEVRTRGAGSWSSALGSITAAKRRRLRCAGQALWRRRFAVDRSVERLRFDVATVSFRDGGVDIEYVPAAF